MGEGRKPRKNALAEGLLASEYLCWFEKTVSSNLKNESFSEEYLPIVSENENSGKQGSVFISVIVCTQGESPELLREGLLCLYAQSDQNFEVLLLGRNFETNQQETISKIVEELEPTFRKKVRLIQVNAGDRAKLLNVGFANAYGEYAAILDDDELVMEDWIKNFHIAAEKNYGKMLHCYAVGQPWLSVSVVGGRAVIQSTGKPTNEYCCNFDFCAQMDCNKYPPLTFAFPLYCFQKYGFVLDERIDDEVELDYAVRISLITGVIDIPIVGAICRKWENYREPQTTKIGKKWENTEKYIKNKVNSMFTIIPASELLDDGEAKGKSFLEASSDRLFWDTGDGYKYKNSMSQNIPQQVGVFSFSYEGLSEYGKIQKLCWSPSLEGKLIIRNLFATISDKKGREHILPREKICSNGVAYHDGTLFLEDNPKFWFDVPKEFCVDSFSVKGELSRQMTIAENSRILRIAVLAKKMLRKLHLRKIEG